MQMWFALKTEDGTFLLDLIHRPVFLRRDVPAVLVVAATIDDSVFVSDGTAPDVGQIQDVVTGIAADISRIQRQFSEESGGAPVPLLILMQRSVDDGYLNRILKEQLDVIDTFTALGEPIPVPADWRHAYAYDKVFTKGITAIMSSVLDYKGESGT